MGAKTLESKECVRRVKFKFQQLAGLQGGQDLRECMSDMNDDSFLNNCL